MNEDDEFLAFTNSTKMVYPIAIIDEGTFNVADYVAQAVRPSFIHLHSLTWVFEMCQTSDNLVYVRRKGVVGGPAFEGLRHRERSFVDDLSSLNFTITPDTEPYLMASYSLNRWCVLTRA